MQGLIIAIIIITFLFNVYKNFKKEMEKAKARGQGAEAIEQAKQQAEAVERKQKPAYRPVVVQEYGNSYEEAVPKENVPTPVFETNRQDYYREQAAKKDLRDAKSPKKLPVLDYSNPEVPPLDVVVNRKIQQPHKHGNLPSTRKEKHLAADFNFRQALIYDAILRRPEY